MSTENPYQTPTSDPVLTQAPVGAVPQLAKLGDRFVGALVDGLIGIAIAIPIWGAMFGLGVVKSMAGMGKIGLGYTIGIGVVHYLVFMAIQWRFLEATGQTIGKKVAKTRIARMDGSKPDVRELVIKRYGFVSLINLIPFIGIILPWVDILMIFKADRRCLHDLVAGTQVLTVNADA